MFDTNKPVLLVLRGIPGSGKSTLADFLRSVSWMGWGVVCTDNYWTHDRPFDKTKLNDAHAWALDQAKMCVSAGLSFMLANTNTQVWEFEPYVKLAQDAGYNVFSIIVENRHGGKSVHEVPDFTIKRMRDRFEVKL